MGGGILPQISKFPHYKDSQKKKKEDNGDEVDAGYHCIAASGSFQCVTICVNFNQAALRAKNFTSMHCTPLLHFVQQNNPRVSPKDPLIKMAGKIREQLSPVLKG